MYKRQTLASVAATLAQAGSAIVGVNIDDEKSAECGKCDVIRLMIQVNNRVHLIHTMRSLRQIASVISIARRLDGDKRVLLPATDQ